MKKRHEFHVAQAQADVSTPHPFVDMRDNPGIHTRPLAGHFSDFQCNVRANGSDFIEEFLVTTDITVNGYDQELHFGTPGACGSLKVIRREGRGNEIDHSAVSSVRHLPACYYCISIIA
jgi:hypothetical protein